MGLVKRKTDFEETAHDGARPNKCGKIQITGQNLSADNGQSKQDYKQDKVSQGNTTHKKNNNPNKDRPKSKYKVAQYDKIVTRNGAKDDASNSIQMGVKTCKRGRESENQILRQNQGNKNL